MECYMYDKIKENKIEKKDTKFIGIIIVVIMVSFFVIGMFAWSFGYRYRFSHFLEKFSECTSYAGKEDSLIAEMDGKRLKVTNDNMQGIFNYITLNGPGKETNKIPEEEPIALDYGNGAVIKIWNVPPDKYSQGNGLFLQYEDMDGNSYSYINYKTNLETIITRYLLYGNVELTEDK